MIFVGILGGDHSKQKRSNLVSRKTSLLVHIETGFEQPCSKRYHCLWVSFSKTINVFGWLS